MPNFHINQIELVAAISKEVGRQHPGIGVESRWFNAIIAAANSICDEFEKPVIRATGSMGLTAWLASDDTGMSSLFMASVLTGQFTARAAYPHDPDDLGRCFRLVEAVPELARRIDEMVAYGPHWAAIVGHWDEWLALYQAGDGKALMVAMMQAYRGYHD